MSEIIEEKVVSVDNIARISLRNNGGFVCHIRFDYINNNGSPKQSAKSTPILLGETSVVDLHDLSVPDGVIGRLTVVVDAGTNNGPAPQRFRYKRDNTHVASYVISGTTEDNTLNFSGRS